MYIRLLILTLTATIAGCLTRSGGICLASEKGKGNPYVEISRISVSGNKRTRQEIILREMSVQAGMHVRRDSMHFLLEQNRKRIFNTTLFHDVTIDTLYDSPEHISWAVRVSERWYIWPEFSFSLADRNFNVWWYEQHADITRANIRATLKDRNFRGNMEEAGISAQIGYTERFGLSYSRPYVDKKQRHGFGFSLSTEKNRELFYQTAHNKLDFARSSQGHIIRRTDLSLFYTWRPQYATRHIFQAAYRDHSITDTVVRLNPEYYENGSRHMRAGELQYFLVINHTDNWNYPLEGFKLLANTIVTGGFTGVRFLFRQRVEAGLFRQPLPRWYTSVIFRGRFSIPGKQPYFLRSGMGNGSDYLRGYEYYVMDGAHYGLLRLNLKRELIRTTIRLIPLPYLPDIPLRVYPKLFADAGFSANRTPGNSFLDNRPLATAGIGLDIITAYDIKLRLEYSLNHRGEHGLYFHSKSE